MVDRSDDFHVHRVGSDEPAQPPEPGSPMRSDEWVRPFSAVRLWTGGAATALVAGLLSVVGILVAGGLFDITLLAPKNVDAWGPVDALTHPFVAAVCALAATGLLEVLLGTTPDAVRLFTWAVLLVTAMAVVLPLGQGFDVDSRVATSVVNGAIGIAIAVTLGEVARRSRD